MGFNIALQKLSETDFKFIVDNGKRSSVLNGFDFESLIYCRWKFLKERLPELQQLGDFELLVLELFADRGINLFRPDVSNMDSNDVFSLVLWVKDQMESISKMEQEFLVSDTDPDMMAAGINELQQFGDLNTIDQLAGGDILKYDAVKSLRYNVIFDKQYKMNVEAKIQKKLIKIQSSKNKK